MSLTNNKCFECGATNGHHGYGDPNGVCPTITRLYTEDKNRAGIESILGKHFDGYTLIPAIGSWHGTKEKTVAEILGADKSEVQHASSEIKTLNNQESVLVTESPVLPSTNYFNLSSRYLATIPNYPLVPKNFPITKDSPKFSPMTRYYLGVFVLLAVMAVISVASDFFTMADILGGK